MAVVFSFCFFWHLNEFNVCSYFRLECTHDQGADSDQTGWAEDGAPRWRLLHAQRLSKSKTSAQPAEADAPFQLAYGIWLSKWDFYTFICPWRHKTSPSGQRANILRHWRWWVEHFPSHRFMISLTGGVSVHSSCRTDGRIITGGTR